MESSDWLIVFLKAPTPGRVKTRLLPRLDAQQAAALYRCLAQDTLAAATAVGCRMVAAYAGDPQWPDVSWLDPSLPAFAQEGPSLGHRIAHAFAYAFDRGARRVAIIGSDAPGLRANWIRDGLEALEGCDAVFGPTTDGGYHLVGLTRPRPELFLDMPWSTAALLTRTRQRAETLGLRVATLPTIRDLDTAEDLDMALATLETLQGTRTAAHLSASGTRALRRAAA